MLRTTIILGKPLFQKQRIRSVLVGAQALLLDSNIANVTPNCCSYHSRAHPQPIPEYGVSKAIEMTLKDIQRRRQRRERKWKRNGVPDTKEQPDETVELALNLNLDPRKPGQSLRGSISLPNGTGKKVSCVVFTKDEELQRAAVQAGASHAGGEDLIDQIVNGEIPVDSFQRSLATNEIMPSLSKKLARVLGPRGLMPNVKVGTLLPSADELLQALETQIAGKDVPYRTEKEGIVHVSVGKGSFGPEKLLENIGQVMTTIFEVKPESFGKGKKKGKATGKGTKYLLRASVSSTQGKGVRMDLRTLDPSSAFFLTSVDGDVKGDEGRTETAA